MKMKSWDLYGFERGCTIMLPPMVAGTFVSSSTRSGVPNTQGFQLGWILALIQGLQTNNASFFLSVGCCMQLM
jgi:hypothetical protein